MALLSVPNDLYCLIGGKGDAKEKAIKGLCLLNQIYLVGFRVKAMHQPLEPENAHE